MNTTTVVTIPATPPTATAQQKGCYVNPRTNRPVFFKKKRQAIAEQNTVALLLAHKPEGYVVPDGPLRFTLKMVWPYRKSERASIVRSQLEVPFPVRPDNTNLAKMIEDAMTAAGYWHDDAQCSTTIIKKRWGPVGYWQVIIEPDTEGVPASPIHDSLL